jgi:hypothetical protein
MAGAKATRRVLVEFEDGTEQTVLLKPKLLMQVERKYGKEPPPVESTLYAVWCALMPGVDFDTWVDTVADLGSEGDEPDEDPSSVEG